MTSGEDRLREVLRSALPAEPPQWERERIKARVLARHAHRHRVRWPVLATGVVAVAAAATMLAMVRPADTVQGSVVVLAREGNAHAETVDGHRARLDTREGHATVGVPGDFSVQALPQTVAAVDRSSGAPTVQLDGGVIQVWSTRRPPESALQVLTPTLRIVVVGTAFTVWVDENDEGVVVSRGGVEVYEGHKPPVRVEAGQGWTLGRDHDSPTCRTESPEPAQPEPVAPAASVPERRARQTPGSSRPRPRAVETPEPAAVEEPGPSAAKRLTEARSLERSGQAQAAATTYEELARGSTLQAEQALYDLGRLRARRLGDPAGALTAWRMFRKRYPAGSLRAEVDLSIIEMLVSLDRDADALAEARAFVTRHPENERKGEVEVLIESLGSR